MIKMIDVAVIGGGAAGLAAALFVARAGLSVAVFDQDRSILKRAQVHNLPGSPVTEGRALLADMRAQCAAAGVSTVVDKVTDIVPVDRFAVHLEQNEPVRATHLVLASGQGTVNLPSLPIETGPARQPFVKVNIVTDRWGETSVPGVWAAGVVAGWPSQMVVCAGSGAAVGIEIVSRVRGEFWVDHDDSTLPRDPA